MSKWESENYRVNMYMLLSILLLFIGKSRESLLEKSPSSFAVLELAKFEAPSAAVDCKSAFDHVKVSESVVRLGLVHFHSICSPPGPANPMVSELTLDHLRGDAIRYGYLRSKKGHEKTSSKKSGIKAPLISGIGIGTRNYIIKIGIGTPQKQLLVVIDTASDVGWVQCTPCEDCYNQVDAYFDSSNSTSYTGLECNSTVCNKLPARNRACSSNGGCIYGLRYGDASITEGDFALETLTIAGKRIARYAFGCGHDNEGLFQGADGLLGLGKGQLSFVSQTASDFHGKFAYCLPPPSSIGYVEFGRAEHIQESSVTPLITNPAYSSFYFLNVQRITLGNWTFSINTSFTPVIDSGTIITRLPSSIYIAARDVFRNATSSLPPASSPDPSFLDTCYDLSSFINRTITIPLLSFYLDSGPIFTVPVNGMLIQLFKGASIFCFAFTQVPDGSLSIIGNAQQQGVRFAFDVPSSTLSFQPDSCS